jgi:hypothetical protein
MPAIEKLAVSGEFLAKILDRAILQVRAPSLFILKLIQAAVRFKASAIAIDTNLQETSVRFSFAPTEQPTGLPQLLNTKAEFGQLDAPLVSGILLSLASEGREFSITFDDGHRRTQIRKFAQELEISESRSQLAGFHFRRVNFPANWWKFWAESPALARLKRDLASRAGFAPINIVLNEKELVIEALEILPDVQAGVAPLSWQESANPDQVWITEWISPTTDSENCFGWRETVSRSCYEIALEDTGSGSLRTIETGATSSCVVAHSHWTLKQEPVVECLDSLPIWTSEVANWITAREPHLLKTSIQSDTENVPKYLMLGLVGGKQLQLGRAGLAEARFRPRGWSQASHWTGINLNSILAQIQDGEESGAANSSAIQVHCRPIAVKFASLQGSFPVGPARLYLIDDGVVLNPLTIAEGPPGAVALICCSGIKVISNQMTAATDNPNLKIPIQAALNLWTKQIAEVRTIVNDLSRCELLRIPLSSSDAWRAYFKENPSK